MSPRPAGRRGHRPRPLRCPRCARPDRGGLRAVAGGRGRGEGDGSRIAARPRTVRLERRLHLAGGGRRHRAGVQGRRCRREAADDEPASNTEPHGNPRRRRAVRTRARHPDSMVFNADTSHPAQFARRAVEPGREQGAGRRAGSGRRLRLQAEHLRGGSDRRRRRNARRQAREVGGGPRRELPRDYTRPRPGCIRRSGRYEGRQDPRPADEADRRPRRVPPAVYAGRADVQRTDVHRHLQDREPAERGARRLHEQDAG